MSLFRRWALPALVVSLSALAPAGGAVRADDAPAAADAKAADALVHKTLREVINEGADMYNAQGRYKNAERDYSGCFHLYEGALMVARPLLGAHPDLQKAIDDGLATARETPRMEMRTFVLRSVIDKVREGVAPAPKEVVAPPPPPPLKETRAEGKAVGAERGKLTVTVDGKPRDFAAPEGARVTIDDREGKLEEIKKDSTVVVILKGDVVTKIEAKSPAAPPPPPPPPPAKETRAEGAVVGAERGKLTVMVDGKSREYAVPETAKVLIDDKEGKLENVKKESSVVVVSKGDAVTRVEAKSPAAPPPPPPPPGPQTLWDRLGGEQGVARVVDDFVNAAGKDPKVNFFRDPTYTPSKEELATIKKKFVEYFSSISGGPLKYEGKSMKEVHAGMRFTNEEFDASVKDLKNALEKNGAKPDDAKAVLNAVEGTRKDMVEEKKPEDKPKPEDKKPEDKPKAEDKKPEDKPKTEDKSGETGSVNGKVTYKGKPVSGGVIVLTAKDGKTFKTELNADGTYGLKEVHPGAYAVAVDTTSKFGDPAEPNAGAGATPKKYADAKTSGLTLEVKKGEQTHDIVLAD